MNAAVDAPIDRLRERRGAPRLLLIAGLSCGALLAATGLIGGNHEQLPPNAVAMVNQRPILRDAWLRAVAGVASEQNRALTAEDQRHILDRLIDEELLVQRGLALGLAEQDGRIRSELVQEVMRSAAASAAVEPGDATLRAFYDANRDFFAAPARLRVTATRDGQPFVPPVPDALLPPSTLRNYLGPALTQVALGLEPGEHSAPQGDDRVVIELRAREAGAAPAFGQVREEVRREFRRRADEAAVRDLLAQLRKSGRVVVTPDP